MKILAELDIRCGQHESFDPACATCCFVRKAEHDLAALKTRRGSIVQQIKERLRTRDLAAIDAK
jgi:hypothetical protein